MDIDIKKWLGVLGWMMLIIGAIVISVPTSIYASGFSGAGSGTSSDPYQITTAEQLAEMNQNLSGHYELRNDLDLTEYLSEDGAGYHDGSGWVPVGTSETGFTGTLDGNGYIITGLRINRPSEDFQGLFGVMGSESTLKNIGLVGVDVKGAINTAGLAASNYGTVANSYTTGVIAGIERVGGLVGGNYREIKSAYSTADVTGVNSVGGLGGANYNSVQNSYATGKVVGASNAGGLVGSNNGTITDSYATGDVTSLPSEGFDASNAGGLAGASYSPIINSSATGDVSGINSVGGLVGGLYASLSNAYATGTVTGSSQVGGLVGKQYNSITNAYASGTVTGSTEVGGMVGIKYSGTITSSYYDANTSGQSDAGKGDGNSTLNMRQQGTYAGWDFSSTWAIAEGSGYPSLRNVDTTAPVVLRATVEDAQPDQVVLVLDESVTINGVSGITITIGGSATTVTESVYDSGANSITLTIDQTVGYGQQVELSYNSSSGTITDSAGNSLSTTTEEVFNYVGKIVSFNANGGSAIVFVRVADGSMITAPAETTRTGYTFIGWYKEAGLTNAWDFSTDTVTASVTLYAKWKLTPQLELGDQSGDAGASIEVPLILTNGQDVAAIEFVLTFDPGFLSLTTDSGDIENIQYNKVADGEYRVLIGNIENDIIPEAVGHLQFIIADNKAYQDTVIVTLSDIIVSDPGAMTLEVAEDHATITVSDTVAPTLTLSATGPDYATSVEIMLDIVEAGSSIVDRKWVKGTVTLPAIQSGGISFTGNSLPITENGAYTVYVEDQAGNGTIATIEVTNYVVKGDARNGDGQYTVDIADWQTVANFILLKEVPDGRQTFAADMNDDGSINVGDWVAIANKLIAD